MDHRLTRRTLLSSIAATALTSSALANPQYDLQRMRKGIVYKFTTKKRPKTLGIELTLDIPRSWINYDPAPHGRYIVQEFALHRPDQWLTGGTLYIFEDIRGQNLSVFLPQNLRHLEVTKTTISGFPASIREYRFDVATTAKIVDPKYMRSMALSVLRHTRHIALTLNVGGPPDDAETIDREFEQFKPLFLHIFQSMTIHN
jgi:hypothetical protein